MLRRRFGGRNQKTGGTHRQVDPRPRRTTGNIVIPRALKLSDEVKNAMF